MSTLQPNPDIPENVLNNTSDKENIIPITTLFTNVGDVVFKGRGSKNLTDLDIGGEHDIVFNKITSKVNRFAINDKYDSEFVIGWLYKQDKKIKIHIRNDVIQKYSQNQYPDNPMKINKKYNALEHK